MKIFSSLKGEWLGIIHNRKLLIAVIGVITIPLLYSGTYLWAFWNPYGHLDRLPVAVVDHDQGAIYNGKKLEIGHDLVKNLKKEKSFNWKFVNEKTANKGLKSQQYYIKIEIPKDFSKNATTLQSNDPKKLDIIYTPNEGFNYLSSKIGDSAIEQIKEKVSSSVTKTYAESMFADLKDVAKGLDKASNGAGELTNGINDAKTGAGDLKSGALGVHSGSQELEKNLDTLAQKSVDFSQGIASASSGSKQLQGGLTQFATGLGQMKKGNSDLLNGAKQADTGAKQLADGLSTMATKLPDLQKGSQQISDGTKQLSSSMEQWTEGAQSTNEGAAQVSAGLQQVVQQVEALESSTSDPAEKSNLEALKESLQQLAGGSSQVSAGVNQLASNATLLKQASDQLAIGATKVNQGQQQVGSGITQLSNGAKALNVGQNKLVSGLQLFGQKMTEAQNGVNSLSRGSLSLSSGLTELSSGSIAFKNGTHQLADGSKRLADGTNQLSNGTKSLTSGMNSLASGSHELESQLTDGAKKADKVKANNSVYNMFAQPVTLKHKQINSVPNYGTGFTPYFLSLSLFVGALMISIIFPMLEPAVEPKSGFGWFVGKFGILLGVGIAQALLADIVVFLGLGLEVKSVPYFIMLSIFTSWASLAIVQFLVTVLDNPGRFLGIIFLVLQLTSSAGTYPIELVPKALQKISSFLPMTYSVDGFRAVISTGDFSRMWENVGYIFIFFIIFIIATLTFFIMKFKRQYRVEIQ